MSSFTIYQSEYAVRTENTRLRGQLAEVRAEANELRRRHGEAEVAYAPLANVGPAAGEAFKTGCCTVAISAPGAGVSGLPQMANPSMGTTTEVTISLPAGARAQAARPQPQLAAPQAQAETETDLEAETTAAIVVARPSPNSPSSIETTGREGQRVVISGIAPQAVPQMNPAIAAARAQRRPAAVAAPVPIAAAPTSIPASGYAEVDADPAALRMSLLEL